MVRSAPLLLVASCWLLACAPRRVERAPTTPLAQPGLPLESRPLLAVSAEASEVLPPDVARLTFLMEAVAATAEEATRQASVRTAAVVSVLSSLPATARSSTREIAVGEMRAEAADPRVRRDERSVVGHYARLQVDVDGLAPASAPELFRRALEAGANAGSITLLRADCEESLRSLRNQAVMRARKRAELVAQSTGTELGALYRVKEHEHACGDETKVLSFRARPADDGSVRTPALRIPAPGAELLLKPVTARVRVLLVYGLAAHAQVPAGETAGEVHVGLERAADAESKDVVASVVVRVRLADADPSAAFHGAMTKASRLIELLVQAGLSRAEIAGDGAQLTTRTEFVERDGERFRKPTDYVAEARLRLSTARVAELGAWLTLAARNGATGMEGPEYTLAHPQEVEDLAIEKAARLALQDGQALARVAGQRLRAVTQIRANDGWLSDTDPLQVFIHQFGEGGGGSGSGFGGGHLRDDAELQPDPAFPAIAILPPTLESKASVAVGFALEPAGH